MISPMTVAPVCNVGIPLNITCNTSLQFISWSILQEGTLEMLVNDVQINSRDAGNQMMTTPVKNLATVTFARSSARFASPLISTLSVDSVSIGLNGTVVRCTDIDLVNGSPVSMTSAQTFIKIIDISQSELE